MREVKIAGVIVAGGQSRRFGSDKAFSLFKGKPFFQHSLQAVSSFADEVIIVTSRTLFPRFNAMANVKVVEDMEEFKGCGPLAGIYTAMNECQAEWYAVLPVDVPLVTSSLVDCLVSKIDGTYDAIVPVIGGKLQPLLALYRNSVRERIYDQLVREEYKMGTILKGLSVLYLTEEEIGEREAFHNINTKQDYDTHIK
ncbi:molybdenum cofactor guanylyltransferase [Rossellomorea vietnamensis]|uniref:Molybdenum cofactor guanylyltransferase n=1 Tax=Rossellomorea vietnamensis TaxID=218284 RepID=A0ACD4C5B5_9BACI|nr:molybdenum cofactor guanylyltransferase [Rossellomorea vietnamensis]UXH43844.1 molybdenum cofactor guanylyltransferase [Rossellomorea vietnamensis]WQI95199.1 molybdenum cofactor guanylyltransferase [Rossellomorea vietnamensis]